MMQKEKVVWYWHRLRAMDATEIAGRVAEKTRAWSQRDFESVLKRFHLGPVNASACRLPSRVEAPSTVIESVARDAAAIREGRWQLFGWKDIEVGDPPQWDWDALKHCRAPLTGESQEINHRQLASGADSRTVWEINRWSELVRLAQNAWLTGALEDGRTVQRWLRDWCERNPPGRGINWCSPLEVALRLINFCWIDALLRGCNDAGLLAEQSHLAARIVPSHAAWIWRHRSFGSSANNHLIGELSALVIASHRWPSLMNVSCCAEKAWLMMEEEVMRQFAADGGNREQALHYHLFAWELAWQAERVFGAASEAVWQRLSAAGGYFACLVHADEPWDFGDSDDAQITPWVNLRARAAKEWQAWFRGGSEGEALQFWLGAPPVTVEAGTGEWDVYDESGQAVKREGGWMARFDASRLGLGSMAAHGHLDALHVSLWHHSRAVMIDPGTGAYYGDPALRGALSGWEAHNGPIPEATRHGPLRMGPFLWTQHHEAPRLRVEEGRAVACLACDGPFVKRQVALSGSGFEVLDEVCTSEPHRVHWCLAPSWSVRRIQKGLFEITHEEGGRLRLKLESDEAFSVELNPTEVSPHFGEVREAVQMRVRFVRSLKTRCFAPS
jgi:hypothetical protein